MEDDMREYPDALRVLAYPRGDVSLFPQVPCSEGETGREQAWRVQAEVGPGQTLGWYLMDGASILPVLALDLKLGDAVLDLCAAPGGKSILMLQTMLPGQTTISTSFFPADCGVAGKLVCNDNQVGRLNRLRNSLLAYIPETGTGTPELRDRIHLTRTDASLPDWAREAGAEAAFDKVLVDAPCTTDRHALHISEGADTGSIFRRSRSAERLALPQAQARILLNGLRATKPGGTLVYATCTLSPLQNEAVVEGAVGMARARLGQDWAIVKTDKLREDLSRAGLFRFYPHSRFGSPPPSHPPALLNWVAGVQGCWSSPSSRPTTAPCTSPSSGGSSEGLGTGLALKFMLPKSYWKCPLGRRTTFEVLIEWLYF